MHTRAAEKNRMRAADFIPKVASAPDMPVAPPEKCEFFVTQPPPAVFSAAMPCLLAFFPTGNQECRE